METVRTGATRPYKDKLLDELGILGWNPDAIIELQIRQIDSAQRLQAANEHLCAALERSAETADRKADAMIDLTRAIYRLTLVMAGLTGAAVVIGFLSLLK